MSENEPKVTEEEKYKGSRTWQEAYENPEEIYSAEEIFDLIQTNQFPKLNPEKMKEGLLEKGLKEEDIDSALRLMACMATVQQAGFDGEQVTLEFVSKKYQPNQDFAAAYFPKKDSYGIFVPDLHEGISNHLKEVTVKLVDKDGKFIKDAPLLTMEEWMLGTAVHEVRHRLQEQTDFKMFSPEDASSMQNKQLKQIIIFVERLFEITKEDLEKAGRGEKIIEDRTSQEEFDSNVVEFLTRNKIHNGTTLKEFFDLVKIQPHTV
jgi:hypothetical protein